jgi:hypothetical protein
MRGQSKAESGDGRSVDLQDGNAHDAALAATEDAEQSDTVSEEKDKSLPPDGQ